MVTPKEHMEALEIAEKISFERGKQVGLANGTHDEEYDTRDLTEEHLDNNPAMRLPVQQAYSRGYDYGKRLAEQEG